MFRTNPRESAPAAAVALQLGTTSAFHAGIPVNDDSYAVDGNYQRPEPLARREILMGTTYSRVRRAALLVLTLVSAMATGVTAGAATPGSAGAAPKHGSGAPAIDPKLTPAEARAIAKDAYIYGFPMVDNMRINYAYFVDPKNADYKAPWNRIYNNPRAFTPDDKAMQTPNSDTPYSFLGLDLRAEPQVLTIPKADPKRYYSMQFIDLWTHNYAYLGSRTSGNDGGTYLLVGPNWKGEKPAGIRDVIRSETELAWILFRTQLFAPDDIKNVNQVQAGYGVQPLSQFLGQPAPKAAPPIDWRPPLSATEQKTSPDFFRQLNFGLQFAPAHLSEVQTRGRFARLGIGPGKPWDSSKLPPEMRAAVEAGMGDAWKEFDTYKKERIDTLQVTSGDLFGSREFLKNDYLKRMSAAVLGIYGNSKAEAMYPAYFVDSTGQPFDGSKHRYTVRFAPGQLPPVDAFWSLTLYELPSMLLHANELNRYLINSPMLPQLKRDADGGITLYVQHESPGKDLESNWLPAPDGPFWMALRLYRPQAAALNGTWKQPPAVATDRVASAGR